MIEQLISLGAQPEQIIKQPCGVDTGMFTATQPQNNEKTLIFVGRFTAKKDPVSLLNAFYLARQSVANAKLVMIGHGELQIIVMKTIDELHLKGAVEVLGWQTPEGVVAQMQRARAYVQHSVFAPNGDSEGTAISILEAAACGLPVVSTRHAGIKESVIEGVTGFLVDEGDRRRMAEYMVKLLQDPELAGNMGQAGRKRMLEYYDIKDQMAGIEKILGMAVNKNR
jgi:glycosyltransferase involved in cell wall biosynthesis